MRQRTYTSQARTFQPVGILQIAIILLTLITAAVHLYLGTRMGPGMGHHTSPAGALPTGAPPGNAPAANPPAGGPPPGARSGSSSIMELLPLPLPTLFILNCVGYLLLLVALYLPGMRHYQTLIRWLLILFAAITIIIWFLINGSHPNLLGYVDKFVEVSLIVLLLIEGWLIHKRQSTAEALPKYDTGIDMDTTDVRR